MSDLYHRGNGHDSTKVCDKHYLHLRIVIYRIVILLYSFFLETICRISQRIQLYSEFYDPLKFHGFVIICGFFILPQ